MAAAREAWTSEWNFDKEDREPEHQLVLGGVAHASTTCSPSRPRSDEEGDGWEMTRRPASAATPAGMWDGLLAHEEVEDR